MSKNAENWLAWFSEFSTFSQLFLDMGVKYEWNGPPQPQMVGFHNLVGTGIAPV